MMLRKKILRKIYFTTLIIFILFVISSFALNKNFSNIKVEYQTKLSSIYLLDDNDYLLKVNIVVKNNLMDNIPIVINSMKEDNKHYSGLRGIIPSNTKIQDIKIDKDVLIIDFNNELLNINSEYEEKVIESIVYTLLEFKEVNGVKITINKHPLEKLPKSNIHLASVLTKDFGINKTYHLTSMNDIQKVVLYYYEEKNANNYYVPITKYVNSHDDKIKIIIENLKTNYLAETNLMSYVNEKVSLEKYEYENNIVTLTFASVADFSTLPVSEEVIYTLANSIMDSMNVEKVIFMQNESIIKIESR